MTLDKLKLKDNKLINASFYLFGCLLEQDLKDVRFQATKALKQAGRAYKVIYSGTITGIKPNTLTRILAVPQKVESYKPINYLDYLNPNPNNHIGISLEESFKSAIQVYKIKYSYFSAYILILQIENKDA